MLLWAGLLLIVACGGLPPLDEQRAQILSGDIRLKGLTSEAFSAAWGPPTYQDRQRTQFYPLKDGNLIPQFRVPLGELPDGWEPGIVSEEGQFFAYAERGEMLGFIESRLVYREQLPAEKIHEIAKEWQRSRLFKTTLESGAGIGQ